MPFSRADRSRLTEWWFTVDRGLIGAVLALMGIGLVLSLAASPAVALKKDLPAFHFVIRHVMVLGLAMAILLAVSLLEPHMVRQFAVALFAAALAAMAAVLLAGAEIQGARRWLHVAGLSVQPSEFAKPAFVVLVAWAFTAARRPGGLLALFAAIGLYAALAVLLVLQPDVGQTVLISVVWGTLYLLSGQPLRGAAIFAALSAAGLAAAYFTLGYVRMRVDRFFAPTPGDGSQVDLALQAFASGGLFGRGPGEGSLKTKLPDAHSDFILPVVAEEFGVLACLAILALFAAVVLRVLVRAAKESDPFRQIAAAGLAAAFGLQALINMGVSVGLLPAKGMTLPLVSSGGSSLLAISITMGMVLALTRRRPDVSRLPVPRLSGAPGGLVSEESGTPWTYHP